MALPTMPRNRAIRPAFDWSRARRLNAARKKAPFSLLKRLPSAPWLGERLLFC
jgi:hypothetical protein